MPARTVALSQPDEPADSLRELVRCHGAGAVLCALGGVLCEHRREMHREGLEPTATFPLRDAQRSCERLGSELQKEGL